MSYKLYRISGQMNTQKPLHPWEEKAAERERELVV
jgi:hypothetical protein